MTPELVADLIRAQFPEVRPVTVDVLGEGCDSIAFEVNSDLVFRFPKRIDVERQLLLEMRVLRALAPESPLPLPSYRFRGRPSPRFPRYFGGYPKLPGRPAIGLHADASPVRDWAPALGGFLSWLHARPIAGAVEEGVELVDVTAAIAEARTEALDDLPAVQGAIPDAPIEQWRALLSDDSFALDPPGAPVFLHGDLAAEHILYDPATLAMTGVIDWSDCAAGDRSVDLSALFHWGGSAFAESVLSAYDGHVDASTLRRAQLLAACRGVADMVFGLQTGRAGYIEAGRRALDGLVRAG